MMKRIKKEPGTPVKSVIKVKINENDEIEYLDPEHNNDDDIPVEYEIEELNDEDPLELVQTSDGHMFIKMEKDKEVGGTIVEHVCGKCSKGFPDFEVRSDFFLKCSLNLINFPIDIKKTYEQSLYR